MASSLDILKSLSSNADNVANPIQVELAQRARLDEMKRALGMTSDTTGGMDKWGNATGSAFATGATPSDVSSLEGDVSKAPYTGDAAQSALAASTAYNRPDVTAMRNQDFAQKLGLAKAPAEAQAAGAVQMEQAKNKGLLDVLTQKQKGQQDLVDKFSGGGGTEGGANPHVKMSINAAGDPTFAQIPETNQTQQMAQASGDILKMMPRAVQLAKELSDAGIFTPLLGSLRQAAAGHGLSTLAGMGPEMAQKISEFNTLGQGLVSGFARAHAGARGAGNLGLIQRFEKLAPMQGDLPSFIGGLKVMTDVLGQYASHTMPPDQVQQLLGQINPTGVGGSGVAPPASPNGTDLGPNWHLGGGQ